MKVVLDLALLMSNWSLQPEDCQQDSPNYRYYLDLILQVHLDSGFDSANSPCLRLNCSQREAHFAPDLGLQYHQTYYAKHFVTSPMARAVTLEMVLMTHFAKHFVASPMARAVTLEMVLMTHFAKHFV